MQFNLQVLKQFNPSVVFDAGKANTQRESSLLKLPGLERPVVVELGNAGLSYEGERTSEILLRSAKRHPEWIHIGIDLKDFRAFVNPNIIHRKADFIEGLSSVEDASANLIFSRFSLGYYTSGGIQLPLLTPNGKLRGVSTHEYNNIKAEVSEYTNSVVDLCCRKLRVEGILYIQVCKFVLPIIMEAAQKCDKVRKFEILPCDDVRNHKTSSYWAKELGTDYRIYKVKVRKY